MPARIMVVEDYPATGYFLARVLCSAGYDATGFESAEAAIAAFSTEPFDLVIADIHLPGMDGVELMRQVRSLKPVPGVAISAVPLNRQANEAACFQAFLLKPVELDDVVATVRQLLQPPSEQSER